jgi:NAD(P)-dependent dehydrogenase (short-subunit alcohol dehydrogenase family)
MSQARAELAGQVAIVTGGGRGLGQAIARALAASGASVAVAARSADQLADTVAAIAAASGRALAIQTNVTDPEAVARLAQTVERELGPVDLLVNNAGVTTPLGPVGEVCPDEWWRCMAIHVRGTFLCCRAVLPGMLARGRGRIVNVASKGGLRPIPFYSAYCASKAAVIRLTETLDAETRAQGVRAFAIHPGLLRTQMTEYLMQSPEGRKWFPWFRDSFDAGKDVPPERAAQLVVLLAAGMADGLSGRFLDVADDLTQLLQQREEIERDDLYTLRLRRPA